MQRVLQAGGEATDLQVSLLKRLYSNSGIEKRHSVLGDYTKTDPRDFSFFPRNWELTPFPGTAARMNAYEQYAVGLAAEAAGKALGTAAMTRDKITHIVISSCTGFFAPGPDVLLLRALGLPSTTKRTVLGFMGCYAGITGMRAAHQIIQADPDAVVLQVAVELCSLHYQKTVTTDTMVANAIFSDGAAAAIYSGSDSLLDQAKAQVTGTHSDISADSLEHMSWRIGDHGFIMTLDAGVPEVLEQAAPAFLQQIAAVAGVDVTEVKGWAIHPGGRKIIEALRTSLRLTKDDVASSTSVLRDYGNMSSATILFVLAAELARGHDANTSIAAMAFGPGLTMEGAMLRTL